MEGEDQKNEPEGGRPLEMVVQIVIFALFFGFLLYVVFF